jgi:single-stranded-DNA-specific exonuclease
MMLISDDEFRTKNPRADEFFASYEAAHRFLTVATDKNERVQVVSHLDADGLTSAAIMLEILRRSGLEYDLRVVQTIDDEEAHAIARIKAPRTIFVDLGSGQLSAIAGHLTTPTLILDHHESDGQAPEGYVHINPLLHGQDGNSGISGAGVVYLLARRLGYRDLARLAIIGAIGDIQENDGFSGFNTLILSDAVRNGSMSVERGIRLFGAQTRPLTKLLAYNHDLQLEGITGDPNAAYRFLTSLGIRINHSRGERRYIDLEPEERMQLLSGILMKRSHLEDPESIIGYMYTLLEEEEGTPFRDAREFSTLLNACGRMDKASVGVGAAMGIPELKREALGVEKTYKRAIGRAIGWFKEQLILEERIERGPGYYLVDGRDEIEAPIIGTLASIASRMDEIKGPALICSYAYLASGDLKASLRAHGDTGHDLHEIMTRIVASVGGGAGGHTNAAGALVPRDLEDAFIASAREVLVSLNSATRSTVTERGHQTI